MSRSKAVEAEAAEPLPARLPPTRLPPTNPAPANPASMAVLMYGIAHCDTVKRARAWFAEQGAELHFHDFKNAGVPADRLPAWLASVGWERLLNRQGSTWRKLDEPRRAAVTGAASAAALMQAEPSVVKRPVVQWPDGAVTVGFDAEDFARRL